jgi:hypothetical protein
VSRRAAGGIAIQWRSSVVKSNSNIYYKCYIANAKGKTQACPFEEVLTSPFIIFL